MKECPVCGARAFSDADVCYGCLHRFDGSEGSATPGPAAEAACAGTASAVAPPLAATPSAEAMPALAAPAPSPATAASGQAPIPVFEAAPASAVVDPSPAAASAPAAEGAAGWVVRFELPGRPPTVEPLPIGQDGGAGRPADGGVQECSFVVSFQPPSREEARLRAPAQRGCHAREAFAVIRGGGTG